MNTFQSFGSCVTYFRRYALSSALGLVTDKDTDAAGEQVKKPKITKERFDKALEAVKSGSYPISELIDKFDLNTEQMKVIKKS